MTIYDNTDDSEVIPMYMSKFVKQISASIETIMSIFEQFDIDLDMDIFWFLIQWNSGS